MLHAISSQPNWPHQCWQACRQDPVRATAAPPPPAPACQHKSCTRTEPQCSVINFCHTNLAIFSKRLHTHRTSQAQGTQARPPTKQDQCQAGHPPLAAGHGLSNLTTPPATTPCTALGATWSNAAAWTASRCSVRNAAARAHSAGCEATGCQTSLGALHFPLRPISRESTAHTHACHLLKQARAPTTHKISTPAPAHTNIPHKDPSHVMSELRLHAVSTLAGPTDGRQQLPCTSRNLMPT